MVYAVLFLYSPVKILHLNLCGFLQSFIACLFISQPYLAGPEARRPLIIASRLVKMIYAGGRRKFFRELGCGRFDQLRRFVIRGLQHPLINLFVLQ